LPFDKSLANKLSLAIPFKKGFTENQCIGSATRAWRELTDKDVKILLSEIEKSERERFSQDTILSTDEVMEILEVDLENFITRNSRLIGLDLVLIGRQLDTPVGRVDLLFEDKNSALIVVELKLNEIGTGALNQIRGYMHYYKTTTKKNVRGVLICKDVLPAFVDKFKNLLDIQVLCFGWKLTVYPRKWD
jgi:RecB family endonuclease NucS